MTEKGYISGHNSAWRRILSDALRQLGYETRGTVLSELGYRWVVERNELANLLRELSGDDFPEDAYLPDVLSKVMDGRFR
jgi:hypothetical protein